ncbi:uncharacterized protein LOC131005389 [Salvia miltiorrhiza]|uniref:uncharacterized protein LOC131005389 n=1 Tax=Salvia miltiorrhiza TaxID=226208 RepID=UPI0025AB8EB1|nr:uncharacterized protein LOC131005389 [Salvia miltiorrhiza]
MEDNLNTLIVAFSPCLGKQDGWKWKSAAEGIFSTKEAYAECAKAVGERAVVLKEESKQLLTAQAPHKARVTAWRAICNRLPTCDNLLKRKVQIPDEEKWCNACVTREETVVHSLLHCPKVDRVWDHIHQWIGIETTKPQRLVEHFKSFTGGGRGTKNTAFLKALWIATVWLLWRYRNDSRFENKNWEVSKIAKDIKGNLWSWNQLFHIVESNVSFSGWCSNEYSPLV